MNLVYFLAAMLSPFVLLYKYCRILDIELAKLSPAILHFRIVSV
jgi:hypothetical protein